MRVVEEGWQLMSLQIKRSTLRKASLLDILSSRSKQPFELLGRKKDAEKNEHDNEELGKLVGALEAHEHQVLGSPPVPFSECPQVGY